ncbi:unnamed protein product [Darwinula stevensoni]|uniref:Uncharacterized protein n=1 Tax=Darwinula stevensoni TaxID=69355 RepID=A0A7R9AD08_9CRUS|nr:unnamed protein product [Darwinula stevensoni]CAG0900307.1 unnamed protein product [Darwinula stevensoni]
MMHFLCGVIRQNHTPGRRNRIKGEKTYDEELETEKVQAATNGPEEYGRIRTHSIEERVFDPHPRGLNANSLFLRPREPHLDRESLTSTERTSPRPREPHLDRDSLTSTRRRTSLCSLVASLEAIQTRGLDSSRRCRTGRQDPQTSRVTSCGPTTLRFEPSRRPYRSRRETINHFPARTNANGRARAAIFQINASDEGEVLSMEPGQFVFRNLSRLVLEDDADDVTTRKLYKGQDECIDTTDPPLPPCHCGLSTCDYESPNDVQCFIRCREAFPNDIVVGVCPSEGNDCLCFCNDRAQIPPDCPGQVNLLPAPRTQDIHCSVDISFKPVSSSLVSCWEELHTHPPLLREGPLLLHIAKMRNVAARSRGGCDHSSLLKKPHENLKRKPHEVFGQRSHENDLMRFETDIS